MSTLFISQKGWKSFFHRFASASLALLLVFQAFGPGLFAIQEALAATNVFSETFGNGSGENDLVSGWTESETNASYAHVDDDEGRSNGNKKHVRLTRGASITKTVDLSGYENINLSYYWRGDAQSEDSGANQDFLKVYWKKDSDANFTELNSHGDLYAKRDSWVSSGQLAMNGANESVIQIRFVGQTTGNDEEARIDDIIISGDQVKKINICHLTASENNPWEAIRINESAWDGGPDHEGHGDFLYNGPVNPQNQQPTKPDGDIWCEDNDPTPPQIELSKTAQYDGAHRVVYTINWKVSGNDVDSLTLTDTLPAWTDLAVNTMSPSTTPPLLPGARNFHPANPTQDRNIVWNLGPQEEGAQGVITFRVELWTKKTCEIDANKVHAHAMFGDEQSVAKDAYSDVVKVNDPHCDEVPPPPDRDNSCMIPNALGDDEDFVLGEAPLAEKDLAQIFAESVPALNINPENDQVNTQVWDIDPNAADAKFGVTLLGKQAGNNQVFGWYKKDVPGSFTGVFRVGDPLNGAYDSLPELSVGDAPVSVTIPVSNGSIGFAIVTDNGSTDQIFFSQKTLNTNDGGKDHVAVYNYANNRYVVAFEDLLSNSWDRDYNDLVVKLVDVRCTPKQIVCEPGVELLANGGFEKPIVTHNAGWNIYPHGATDLDWGVEWLLPSSTQYEGVYLPDIANLELHKGGSVNPLWLADEGAQYAELDTDWGGPDNSLSGEPASVRIYQDIPTVPGKDYLVKFAFAPRPGTGMGDNMLNVLWGGNSATGTISRDGIPETTNIWRDYVVKVTATSTMTRVAFADAGLNSSNSLGVFLDSASVQCAPDCNPTSGSVVSDETTLITKVEVGDPSDDDVIDYPAVPVVVLLPQIKNLGPGVWGADVGDVNAKWVWSEDPVSDWEVNKWVSFKKTFTVVGTPESGSLKIASDNSYEVWVNGQPGLPPMVDASEDNHSSADTWDVSSLLVNGSNTLEIRVKNLELPGAPQLNNPGGLLFNLSWTAKDCGDDNPTPGTSVVTVRKYVDGKWANTIEENQTFNTIVTGGPTGDLPLSDNNNYENKSSPLTDNQNHFELYEETTAQDQNSLVVPVGGECTPGKYRLVGYTTGSSWLQAEESNNVITEGSVTFNNIETDKYVIVWNEKCPLPPPTSTITMCKEDEKEKLLSGWTLMLLGDQMGAELTVDSTSPSGVNSIPLTAGTPYVAISSGTWNNQGGANVVDSEYSTTDAWATQMDGYTGYPVGILELEINQADGVWGAYNSLHTYAQGFTPGVSAPANFRIFDGMGGVQYDGTNDTPNWFADNSGSLRVNLFEGYMGVTGENGCVVFEDVPYGEYEAREILKEGWSRVDGNTSVVVNDPLETFTVVNRQSGEECEINCGGGGNNPQYGGLIIEKIVVGSDASPTTFALFVDGMPVVSGVATTTVVGSHTVTETPDSNYTLTFGESCPNGVVTVTLGATTTCQVINTFKTSSGDNPTPPGGGGSSTNTTGQSRSGRGGSSGGNSFLPNVPAVAGAFTELPGLPDTGNAPIGQPQTSSVNAIAIILSGLVALLGLNFISFRVLKLHKKN